MYNGRILSQDDVDRLLRKIQPVTNEVAHEIMCEMGKKAKQRDMEGIVQIIAKTPAIMENMKTIPRAIQLRMFSLDLKYDIVRWIPKDKICDDLLLVKL